MNTRLYMDFLRMEGEGNFLSLLPAKDRKPLGNIGTEILSKKLKNTYLALR